MCSVKLKYNGTLSTRTSGCLSFSLRTRGQPGKDLLEHFEIMQMNKKDCQSFSRSIMDCREYRTRKYSTEDRINQ